MAQAFEARLHAAREALRKAQRARHGQRAARAKLQDAMKTALRAEVWSMKLSKKAKRAKAPASEFDLFAS